MNYSRVTKFVLTIPDDGFLLSGKCQWKIQQVHGTGNNRGSFNVVVPKIMSNSIFTFRSDGELCLNFGWLEGSEQLHRFRDDLRRDLANELGITLESSAMWPCLQLGEWMSKAEGLLTTFEKLVSGYS